METIDIDNEIDEYRNLAKYLGDIEIENDTDATYAMIERNIIQDHWNELTDTQKKDVEVIDGIFCSKHEYASEALPLRSSTDENRQRGRWWWFLDEGPQVRETIGRYLIPDSML